MRPLGLNFDPIRASRNRRHKNQPHSPNRTEFAFRGTIPERIYVARAAFPPKHPERLKDLDLSFESVALSLWLTGADYT